VEHADDGLDPLARVDQAGLLLGRGLGAAQGFLQPRVGIAGLLRDPGRGVATVARQRLADAELQVRVAAEAELLAELDHRGLAHAQGAGQLLRGVVTQQVGVVEDEVRDAALDRRHLVAFGTDLYQGRHGGDLHPECRHVATGAQRASGSRPRIWRMPRPGASVMLISDSLKMTPPSTGLNWPSEGPSRSTLLIASALATARCTAAATEMA